LREKGRIISEQEEKIRKLERELEELKIKNQVLETIFEDTLECIVMVDANGYVTMMNQTYANFLGIKPEEAIGKHVTDVIENTRLHIVVKTGELEVGQIQRIKGHDAVTMRIPIIQNGKILGAIGKVVYKDIKEVELLYKKLEVAKRELDFYKERLRKVKGEYYVLDTIIGDSDKIKELKRTIVRIANTDSTVLITGESGTGKEVFANVIHEMSNRRDNNFIKINCAAIPENILESELFGYEDGAFTGARRGGKIGKFELADQGTIFLDEIGDMSFDMQAKLLRVLQEKEIERVGGNTVKKINVRIIAATNQNLQEKIKRGEFREDLYYRLNVIALELPPLRERVEDIPLLCEYFLKKYNDKFGIYIEKIDDEAMDCLKKYSWPGNIRELENAIERAYNLIDGNVIKLKHLPEKIVSNNRPLCVGSLNKTLNEIEKQRIIDALKASGGNKSKAAKMLGINRAGLYQKLKKHGINYF
jgi:transcriptional regulator with PAS, ATPase and Fis domain